MRLRQSLLIIVLIIFTPFLQAQSIDNEALAFQLNDCKLTLVYLNESPNLRLYDKVRNDLLNNLSKEGMVKIPKVTEFRNKIYKAISDLSISEEEKMMVKKLNTMSKEGAKWQAISNGLNQAMILVPGQGRGGAQLGFYTLLTVARSAIDYAGIQNDLAIQESKSMWIIRKEELKKFAALNTDSYELITDIFKTYNLQDKYEVRDDVAKEFVKIISYKDNNQRCQQLESLIIKDESIKYLNDYYYYLGMAYFDCRQFDKADKQFNTYIANEKKAHIFKNNDKLGYIYLAKLAYGKNMSKQTLENYSSIALKNLKNNGLAYIQCASVYFAQMKDPERAFRLLLRALNDEFITDKDAIVLTISEWMPSIKKSNSFKEIYKSVCNTIEKNSEYISLNSYLHFLYSCGTPGIWDKLDGLITITDYSSIRDFYLRLNKFGKAAFDFSKYELRGRPIGWIPLIVVNKAMKNFEVDPSEKFCLYIWKDLSINLDYISVLYENYSDGVVTVQEKDINSPKGFSKEKLTKKFSLLKDNPDMISIFFYHDQLSKQYYVKGTLTQEDFNILSITPYNYPGMDVFPVDFTSTDTPQRKELNKIIEFCKENQNQTPPCRVLQCSPGSNLEKVEKKVAFLDNYFTPLQRINSLEIDKLVKKNRTTYAYSLTSRLSKGRRYNSRIFINHPGEFIKIQIQGQKSSPIYLTYKVKDGKAEVYSLQLNNKIIYRNSINVFGGNSKTNKKILAYQ